MTTLWRKLFLAAMAYLLLGGCDSESFRPEIHNPQYLAGQGPTVLIDEAHNNFHTADGKYRPFCDLLRLDGYVVKPLRKEFTKEELSVGDILVISNALNARNKSKDKWSLPAPSAFTQSEIAAVRDWVSEGRSLLLIADHMPFPGAAEELADVFGFELGNNYAWNKQREKQVVFRRSDGSLKDHPITNGRTREERIDSVVTFRGHAFRATSPVDSLLVFGPEYFADVPDTAGRFKGPEPMTPISGWLQGAALKFGRGRVAIFGEAAMFTNQIDDEGRPIGLWSPRAKQNVQFVLNLLHWLSAALEPSEHQSSVE